MEIDDERKEMGGDKYLGIVDGESMRTPPGCVAVLERGLSIYPQRTRTMSNSLAVKAFIFNMNKADDLAVRQSAGCTIWTLKKVLEVHV